MRAPALAGLVIAGLLSLSFGITLASDPPRPADAPRGWMFAARHSSGLAPDPAALADTAIVQVYAAPTYGWRGYFAVHPWIIFKRAGETAYTRYEVIGFGTGNHVQRDRNVPDGLWFGAVPRLLVDKRGPDAAALIAPIEAAISSYPWPDEYRAWPGPNSNTFLAHIGREVPELGLDLPANAIGKDYRPLPALIGRPPSGSGVQLSLYGMLGLILSPEEGIEFNVLGLSFGVDLNRPALRLPSVGRLGVDGALRSVPAAVFDTSMDKP